MSRDRDEDALSWGDESDPTYIEAREPVAAAEPATQAPVAANADTNTDTSDTAKETAGEADAARPTLAERRAAAATAADDDLPPVTSSAVLLTIGILAGAYIFYTIGWFITTQRSLIVYPSEIDTFMASVRGWLATAAPVIWFGAVVYFTRRRKPIHRLLWLVLGVVVLVPLPFVLGN